MLIETDRYELHLGDCFEVMRTLPAESVDAIIADPPYGTMQGRIDWDESHLPTKQMFNECYRVLRPRGAVVLFAQGDYTKELMTNTRGNLPLAYRMIWVKNHFGNPLNAKRAPVNHFEDICVYFGRGEHMKGHELQEWFMSELTAAGLTPQDMVDMFGNGGVRHHFTRGKVWRLPTRERYEMIRVMTGRFNRDYDELDASTDWETTFNLPTGQKVKSNVLCYDKDPGGVHPTQKPVDLMRDLVRTYSNPGDTVLDFTMGSGSTGVAAIAEGRKFIGIERDDSYWCHACGRVATIDDDVQNGIK